MFDSKDAEEVKEDCVKLLDTLEYGYINAEECEEFVKTLDMIINKTKLIRKYYCEES